MLSPKCISGELYSLEYKTDCFELFEMIHYSMIVSNISEEKANEIEIQVR